MMIADSNVLIDAFAAVALGAEIAGVCLANGGVLLTRNLDHFERVPGLKISGRMLNDAG